MVFLCIASIVWSSIALHGIALHRIAWHCIAFDYLSWYCMVLHRLHGVVQLIWRAGELPRSASSHFMCYKLGGLVVTDRARVFRFAPPSRKVLKGKYEKTKSHVQERAGQATCICIWNMHPLLLNDASKTHFGIAANGRQNLG